MNQYASISISSEHQGSSSQFLLWQQSHPTIPPYATTPKIHAIDDISLRQAEIILERSTKQTAVKQTKIVREGFQVPVIIQPDHIRIPSKQTRFTTTALAMFNMNATEFQLSTTKSTKNMQNIRPATTIQVFFSMFTALRPNISAELTNRVRNFSETDSKSACLIMRKASRRVKATKAQGICCLKPIYLLLGYIFFRRKPFPKEAKVRAIVPTKLNIVFTSMVSSSPTTFPAKEFTRSTSCESDSPSQKHQYSPHSNKACLQGLPTRSELLRVANSTAERISPPFKYKHGMPARWVTIITTNSNRDRRMALEEGGKARVVRKRRRGVKQRDGCYLRYGLQRQPKRKKQRQAMKEKKRVARSDISSILCLSIGLLLSSLNTARVILDPIYYNHSWVQPKVDISIDNSKQCQL